MGEGWDGGDKGSKRPDFKAHHPHLLAYARFLPHQGGGKIDRLPSIQSKLMRSQVVRHKTNPLPVNMPEVSWHGWRRW